MNDGIFMIGVGVIMIIMAIGGFLLEAKGNKDEN